MKGFVLFFNTFLLYCAAGFSPYAFRDIRNIVYPNDDFRMITYAEYLEKEKEKQIKYGIKIPEEIKQYTLVAIHKV